MGKKIGLSFTVLWSCWQLFHWMNGKSELNGSQRNESRHNLSICEMANICRSQESCHWATKTLTLVRNRNTCRFKQSRLNHTVKNFTEWMCISYGGKQKLDPNIYFTEQRVLYHPMYEKNFHKHEPSLLIHSSPNTLLCSPEITTQHKNLLSCHCKVGVNKELTTN